MSIDKLHPNRDTLHPNRLASMPKGIKHWNYNPNPSILAMHKRIHRKHGKASIGLKKAYSEGRR